MAVKELDDQAYYDPVTVTVLIRVPARGSLLRRALIHEWAHHLEFQCAAQGEMRRAFLAAQALPPDTPWRLEDGSVNMHAYLWAKIPSEQFAETVAAIDSENARRDHGLAISVLNCSGNQLAPGAAGKAHDVVVRKTFQLANLLDIHRVVMMSGLPAAPGDSHPNWITVAWPPEVTKILTYQWNEVAIPYWRELVTYGNNLGVNRICIELHVKPMK